jgi:hypothetical protein
MENCMHEMRRDCAKFMLERERWMLLSVALHLSLAPCDPQASKPVVSVKYRRSETVCCHH